MTLFFHSNLYHYACLPGAKVGTGHRKQDQAAQEHRVTERRHRLYCGIKEEV